MKRWNKILSQLKGRGNLVLLHPPAPRSRAPLEGAVFLDLRARWGGAGTHVHAVLSMKTPAQYLQFETHIELQTVAGGYSSTSVTSTQKHNV